MALSAFHGLLLTVACIAFSFSVIIMLELSFEKLFQAVGRMKTTMTAFLLCHFLGPDGVWRAFWITEVVTVGAALRVYRRTVNSSIHR